MQRLEDRWRADRPAPIQLVLLPPAQASLQDLIDHGFIEQVRRRELAVDMTLADIGYSDVMAGRVAEKLEDALFAPLQARAPGSAIWVAGISLGAFNALYYASRHARRLAGMLLMAPYPGTADILAEIRQYDDARAWAHATTGSLADERRWWHWLALRQSDATPVTLGLSDDDRFLAGQQMMAELLPAQRIIRVVGKHAWPSWQAIWSRWLDSPQPAAWRQA